MNHYDFYYESVVGDRVINPIPVYVKLETELRSYSFPTEERMICDYYLQNKPHRNARHLYDIYKLANKVEINDSFMDLMEKVRNHRITLGSEIAPAASREIDIREVAGKICKTDFYKEDYRDTTMKLTSDNLEYDMLKNFYLELVERIF